MISNVNLAVPRERIDNKEAYTPAEVNQMLTSLYYGVALYRAFESATDVPEERRKQIAKDCLESLLVIPQNVHSIDIGLMIDGIKSQITL